MPDTITLPPAPADLDLLPDRDVLLLAAQVLATDGGGDNLDRELEQAGADLFAAGAHASTADTDRDHRAVTRALVKLARVAIRQEIDAGVGAEAGRG